MLFERELITALSPGECEQRLKAAMDQQRWFHVLVKTATKPVYGRVEGRRFHFQQYRFQSGRMDNQPMSVLKGRLDPLGPGTRISYRFGFSRAHEIFAVVWLAFPMAAMIAVPGLIALPMLGFFAVFIGVIWHLGRSDREFLTSYLRQVLSVEDALDSSGQCVVT